MQSKLNWKLSKLRQNKAMSETDVFARTLLEESKAFLDNAKKSTAKPSIQAHLHASLLLCISSLEAHLHSICEDFLARGDVGVLDRSILEEHEIRLEHGEFVVTSALKMYRLEERFEYIYRRFSGKSLPRTESWWADLKAGLDIRNQIVHPKASLELRYEDVSRTLLAVISGLNSIYRAIYKKRFPTHRLGLDSRLNL